jgi:Contractile injection system tube protein
MRARNRGGGAADTASNMASSSSSRPTSPPIPSQRLAAPSGARVEKVIIGSLDEPTFGVVAQYNPKEVSIDKSIPWTPHKTSKSDQPELEFAGGDGRTMTMDLTFDGYESGVSVEASIDALIHLSNVRNSESNNDDDLRPHLVAVAWGNSEGDSLRPFRGVITSISTKYTMFLPNGTPVRATCTVKVQEANLFKKKKPKP